MQRTHQQELKRTIITLARAAIFPSSEEHCSRILPVDHEVEVSASIDLIHLSDYWLTHPEQDRVVQVMEQFV
jgi:hypothetical protein